MRLKIYLTALGISLSVLFGSVDTLYYDLTIFGIKCGEISYLYPQKNRLLITARSTGLIDYIFPFENNYDTTFDTSFYGVQYYNKLIRQGNFKQQVSGEWDGSSKKIVYEKLESFQRPNSCMNLFSFLARLNKERSDMLDTQWFPVEHEGNLFKSRVLIADTIKMESGGRSVLCNHFRLDLIPLNDQIKMLDRSDYFSQNITRPEAIKQVWVEQNNLRRIMKASAKIGPIAVVATLRQ